MPLPVILGLRPTHCARCCRLKAPAMDFPQTIAR
jgi:hypothetical protein